MKPIPGANLVHVETNRSRVQDYKRVQDIEDYKKEKILIINVDILHLDSSFHTSAPSSYRLRLIMKENTSLVSTVPSSNGLKHSVFGLLSSY